MPVKYAHMRPNEVFIWERFLEKYEKDYDRFEYDVHLHVPIEFLEQFPIWMQKDIAALAALKIDVVAWKNKKPTIIEIKDRLGMTGLGQLLTYKDLFMQQIQKDPPPNLVLVTPMINPVYLPTYEKHNIKVLKV